MAAVFAATTRWPTKAEVESMAAISFVGRFRFSGRVRLARVRLCVPGWAIQQPCSKPPPVCSHPDCSRFVMSRIAI